MDNQKGSLVTRERQGMLIMMLTAILFSTSGLFIKLIPWSAMCIAGSRSLVAVVPFIIYMRLRNLKLVWNRKTLGNGLLLMLLTFLFVNATKLTTAANAIILQFTAPIFLVLISMLFLGKRYRGRDFVAVILTFAGIALCFADQLSPGSMLGNILGLLSGVAYAGIFAILGVADTETRVSGMIIGLFLTAVVGIPFFTITPVVWESSTVLTIALLGLFQLGIPYIMLTIATGRCSALACCLISAVEPLLNPIWVALVIGETPGLLALFGGITVIATVTVWSIISEIKPTN